MLQCSGGGSYASIRWTSSVGAAALQRLCAVSQLAAAAAHQKRKPAHASRVGRAARRLATAERCTHCTAASAAGRVEPSRSGCLEGLPETTAMVALLLTRPGRKIECELHFVQQPPRRAGQGEQCEFASQPVSPNGDGEQVGLYAAN